MHPAKQTQVKCHRPAMTVADNINGLCKCTEGGWTGPECRRGAQRNGATEMATAINVQTVAKLPENDCLKNGRVTTANALTLVDTIFSHVGYAGKQGARKRWWRLVGMRLGLNCRPGI